MSRVLPILFNTEMVQAILEGRKTVTRRVIKNLPEDAEFGGWLLDSTCQEDIRDIGKAGFKTLKRRTEKAGCIFVKPPYQLEDILYVRETWCKSPFTDNYIYRADGERELFSQSYDSEIMDDTVWTWKPSIHMPKEAARIFLKVKDVLVERLQDIDDDGVVAEGLKIGYPFDELWNSTIKKADTELYGWDANPWVWVIEFERCEKPEEWE